MPQLARTRHPWRRTIRRWSALVVAGALLGCEEPVALEVPWLELPGLPSGAVELRDLDPDEDAVFTVRIRNRGTATADVRFEVDGPIEVLSGRLRIAPNRTSPAGFQVLSDGSAAPVEGRIWLDTGVQEIEIPVTALFDDR